jgi:hypothetical protein
MSLSDGEFEEEEVGALVESRRRRRMSADPLSSSVSVVSSCREKVEPEENLLGDLEETWDAWEGCRPERWAPLGANDSDKEHSTCGPLDDG